ncbi:glycosyltransferase family 2 protein [Novipirellula artificiosorum]|uniref:Glycosyl transferase family 2 n=1 Tax=Novipirellula artificiosorum TaxID=2528016 RepID=A0A5C6E5U1_9BACT|nr:glycosyltransferase family 2 protein [Novipirellula artificiosorum]TWU42846.1 hypothetical protein Poly41_11470 [Novipirellula artificiosorum]
MPKIPLLPHLSVVVPVGQDTVAFENSLISVLEHQPAACEVIVAHDGHYDDPFGLSGEVRFVTADSSDELDLIAKGVDSARGRLVHVLGSGLKATAGWTDAALEKFEHSDVVSVAPVVRQIRSNQILAAGWHDHPGRLCEPTGAGQSALDRRDVARIDGVFIEASFWRRETLRGAVHCYRGTDLLEASYCAGLAAKTSDWRSVTAENCEIQAEDGVVSWNTPSFRRGKRLAAIRQAILGDRKPLSDAFAGMICNLTRPSRLSEALGQFSANSAAAEMQRRVRVDEVKLAAEALQETIRMQKPVYGRLRRAA